MEKDNQKVVKIKNIVLDWGMVLAYPATGNWFITPKTSELLGQSNYKNAKHHIIKLKKAFSDAFVDITENHLMHTEKEEIEQFAVFYTKIIEQMEWKIPENLTDQNGKKVINTGEWGKLLACDLVENPDHVLLYEDSISMLNKMNENYQVYILSDNWPSLTSKMRRGKVDCLVEGTVISCDYGICKDDRKLFQEGIQEWGINPEESIFADDNTINLENARLSGFTPLWMKRYNLDTKMSGDFPVVHDLQEILDFCNHFSQRR